MEKFMEQALVEARNTQLKGEVPVGCLFIYNNQIIASAGNLVNATKNSTRHAELICIDQTLDFCLKHSYKHEDIFAQITVVVTVEPCIMCASALNSLGFKQIVYGCANDRFGGTTVVNVEKLLGRTIPTISGVRSDEALQLLKEFYKGQNPSAPVPKEKRATTKLE